MTCVGSWQASRRGGLFLQSGESQMKPHHLFLGGLLLAALTLMAGAQTDKGKKKARVYKTPQAVFEAAQAASKKGFPKAFVACIAPEAQKKMAGGLALAGLDLRAKASLDEK